MMFLETKLWWKDSALKNPRGSNTIPPSDSKNSVMGFRPQISKNFPFLDNGIFKRNLILQF